MSPFRGQFSPDPHLGHIGQRIPCLLLWLNPYSSPSFPACIPAFSLVSSHYLIVKSVRLLRSVFSSIVYKWNAPQYATLRRQAIIKIIELCSRQYKLLPFAKTFTCIAFARDREKKKAISAAHSSSSCSLWLKIDCNLLSANKMSPSPQLHHTNSTFSPLIDSPYKALLCSPVTFPHDNSSGWSANFSF